MREICQSALKQDNSTWDETTRTGVLELIEMLYRGRESVRIDIDGFHAHTMELNFMKRQWYVNLHTGKCRMEHHHWAKGGGNRIAIGRKRFDSVKAMTDYILEKLW